MRTVNGSPARRAPTVTLTSVSPAPTNNVFSPSGVNPSQRSPSRSRTQDSACSRRSSTSTRPPGYENADRLAAARATDPRRGGAPVRTARRRRSRSSIGSFFERAAFPGDVGDTASRRQRARPLQHVRRSIDGNDARRPAAGLDRQVALAASEIGDDHGRQQVARARAPTPPSFVPAPAVARWCPGPRARRSSLGGAAGLLRAARCRPGRCSVRPARSNWSWSSIHRGACPLSPPRTVRCDAVVRESGLALLTDQAAVLEKPEMARHARLRNTQDARQLGHVQPLERSSLSSRSRTSSPSSRYSAEGSITSINLHL